MENPIWASLFPQKNRNELTDLLAEIPAFDGLNSVELSLVARAVHTREYKNGEEIFAEGAPGAALYIVKEGEVVIAKGGLGDKKVELARISRPSFFGEIALVEETPRTAGAVAEGKTTLLAFGRPNLEQLVETHPRIANKIVLNISKLLSRRLIKANETIEKLSSVNEGDES